MDKSLLHRLEVTKLWGYRHLDITFNPDVNILIGPNGSGKTTILDLLRFILTADLFGLRELDFGQAKITLQAVDSSTHQTLAVDHNDQGYQFRISQKTFTIDFEEFRGRQHFVRRPTPPWHLQLREIREELAQLVPAVWLPVSRRLPIHEEEDDELRRSRHPRLESVDMRLRDLIGDLSKYRLKLGARLSDRYKEFEKRVLEMILYSKQRDKMRELSLELPTEGDKNQITRAFKESGLLDAPMVKRIEEHFTAAKEAIERINAVARKKEEKDYREVFDDLMVIPLIHRTKLMVETARILEQDREKLFAPLRRYEKIVNGFLKQKTIRVEDTGDLYIEALLPSPKRLLPDRLSSGEKQILILLTQALLFEDSPVVYVADEPELSLHVRWQENLIQSLRDLGAQIQIILATHSPDIVGSFVDKTIDLEKWT